MTFNSSRITPDHVLAGTPDGQPVAIDFKALVGMVEETSAETQRLKDEALDLATKLKRFRIETRQAEAERPAAAPARPSPAVQTARSGTAASPVTQTIRRTGGAAAAAVKSEPVHDNGWEEF